jgi:glycosyltransferase involved in cell wall biosynthesis
MPDGIAPSHFRETGLAWDFIMAAAERLPVKAEWARGIKMKLTYARARVVDRVGADTIQNESAVIASWGCAQSAFRKMKERRNLCVLNYPLAHHRFTRKFLREEAMYEPRFASTLNGHDWPTWLEEQFDAEILLADRILVGSRFARDSFVAEGVPIEKLHVIPYGANTALFEPIAKPATAIGRLNVLFVGQIGQRKGLSYLLNAYKRFKGPETSLTLVGKVQGDGGALADYRDLFIHVEHVPRSSLREIYRHADVFLFPTLVEGMGIVVLEAMASGLPVITTPNGPGDIVRDGVDGFLVPVRNVDAIVEKLEFLRTNPQIRHQMGRNARARALEFTWNAYQQTAIDLVRSWLNSASA